MFASQVAVVQRRRPDRRRRPAARTASTPTRPCTRRSRELVAAARAHPALADGAQIHRYASTTAGIFAFSRIDADEQRRVPRRRQQRDDGRRRRRSTTYSRDGRFRAVYGGGDAARAPTREGRVTVTVPPLSVQVFRAEQRGRRSRRQRAGAVVRDARRRRHRRRPGRDRRRRCRTNAFSQVTFACRPVGTDDWKRARHRRQRAVPRVPRRHRPRRRARWSSTARCSEDTQRQLLGAPALRHRRRRRRRPAAAAAAASADVDAARRGQRARRPQQRDGLPGRLAARLRPGPADARPERPDLEGHVHAPGRRYAYKAAINQSWDENYGAGGVPTAPNIPLTARRRSR